MQVLNGFVKIHRKLIQWGWYQDNVVKGVFLHLLLTASFRDAPWQGRIIKKGQCIVGTQKMADELGFTRQQVRTAINKLKSTSEITTEITNKFTIVTIVNWEDYQCFDENTTNKTTNTVTNNQPTDNQQITNNQPHRKNVKEFKEGKENIYCAFFDSVWDLYPNKKGKSKVSKKAIEELQELGFEKIKQCIDAYVLQKPDWQQWQNGSTFFNGGYKDYLENEASDSTERTSGLPGDMVWQ